MQALIRHVAVQHALRKVLQRLMAVIVFQRTADSPPQFVLRNTVLRIRSYKLGIPQSMAKYVFCCLMTSTKR